MSETPPEEKQKRRSWKRTALEVVVLAVVFLLIHSFVLQAFVVRGASMDPTLRDGDRLVIWKPGRAWTRGDLVVFDHPHDGSRALVKRIVGLPGETLEIRAGRVFVDDRELGEAYLTRDEDRAPTIVRPPEKIPPGSYYVMGDNRGNSQDSRQFGPLEAERILGRALFVVWPPRSIR